MKRVAIVAIVALALCSLASCAELTGQARESYRDLKKSIHDTQQKRPDAPENTVACLPKEANILLLLEQNTVIPAKVAPGGELDHHLQYTLCAPSATTEIAGRITRRIVHSGKTVFQEGREETFRSGTWVLDAYFTIPKKAKKGSYRLEVELDYGQEPLRQAVEYTVK